MADNTIKIGGELESMATGKIVAAASAIKDKTRNKTQEVINGDVEQALNFQTSRIDDKPYDPTKPNEMGRKVLSSGKTFAQQVTDINTIYEIRHDFSVIGSFTMPANCVLLFNGGHLTGSNNAVLNGNRTRLEGNFDSLKSVMGNIALGGTYTNEQTAFSWWGAYKNDSSKDVYNGKILKYLLANKGDITFDGTFYVRLGETVEVNRPITFTDGEVYWTDAVVAQPYEYIKPAEEFSLYAKNVIFHNSGNTRGFIYHDAADFIIDTLKFEGCSFIGMYRSVVITFADLPLTDTIGIRNFALINCTVKNTSMCFHIDDGQFIDTFSVLGCDFIEFTGSPLYFAATNFPTKTYASDRTKFSCVANFKNNTFICTTPCTSSTPYHCAVLAELGTINFEGNHIEGIASTMTTENGEEVGCTTSYDAYLSADKVFYRNNIIRNVLGWRLDGQTRAATGHPRVEIFKSKTICQSKVISGNLFEIDAAWLEANNVPADDNWIEIFRYERQQDNVIFENNTINIPYTKLEGRAAVNSGYIVNMTMNNNTIIAKSINRLIHTGGEPAKTVAITNNTFKASVPPINILAITKADTALDSVIVRNNQSNQMLAMTPVSEGYRYPSIGYYEWDSNTEDFNEEAKGLYYYTGDGKSKSSISGNASNNHRVYFYGNTKANLSAEFAFANILRSFGLYEALVGAEEETKSYTVATEVMVNGTPLRAECTVQRVEVDTDVYEVQWYATWQTLRNGTITNNEFYGKVGDVAKNVLRGSKFYGVVMNVDSEKFVVGKYSQDMRDDYTDIKYSLRNNGNSRTFVYDSSKDGSTIDPFPMAFPDMNFEGSYGRSIKFINDHVEYKQVTNATRVQFLLTQYAVPNLDTNEEGWWPCVISSDSHYYMRIVSENNCGSTIEDVELEIRSRKGFEAYSNNVRVSIPSGSSDQVVDIAELLRDANPQQSYQLITHFTVYGIYSATADANDTIDITVNVYEASTTNPNS